MEIDLNETEVKLLVGLVKNAYADVYEALDQYDECGDPMRLGAHPAQILSNELDVLREMELKLNPIIFGGQGHGKKRITTEVA